MSTEGIRKKTSGGRNKLFNDYEFKGFNKKVWAPKFHFARLINIFGLLSCLIYRVQGELCRKMILNSVSRRKAGGSMAIHAKISVHFS